MPTCLLPDLESLTLIEVNLLPILERPLSTNGPNFAHLALSLHSNLPTSTFEILLRPSITSLTLDLHGLFPQESPLLATRFLPSLANLARQLRKLNLRGPAHFLSLPSIQLFLNSCHLLEEFECTERTFSFRCLEGLLSCSTLKKVTLALPRDAASHYERLGELQKLLENKGGGSRIHLSQINLGCFGGRRRFLELGGEKLERCCETLGIKLVMEGWEIGF